ncbi:MAG: hypothetical protein CMJ70_03140 [Planctomycetaceae bacterium]|nr:hypothetical protein [Planctomycetaceae bacterium]
MSLKLKRSGVHQGRFVSTDIFAIQISGDRGVVPLCNLPPAAYADFWRKCLWQTAVRSSVMRQRRNVRCPAAVPFFRAAPWTGGSPE